MSAEILKWIGCPGKWCDTDQFPVRFYKSLAQTVPSNSLCTTPHLRSSRSSIERDPDQFEGENAINKVRFLFVIQNSSFVLFLSHVRQISYVLVTVESHGKWWSDIPSHSSEAREIQSNPDEWMVMFVFSDVLLLLQNSQVKLHRSIGIYGIFL